MFYVLRTTTLKATLLFIIPFFLIACVKKEESNSDVNDKILDIIIENSNGESIEFPQLYEYLADSVPNDENENLKLVDKLKAKGFKVVNWGRGNYPPLGPRIISFTLKKEDCECEVSKIYYSTIVSNKLKMTEKVNCNKINN